MFHYSGTILWNDLPTQLKIIEDNNCFKLKYMEYLLHDETKRLNKIGVRVSVVVFNATFNNI
jgi:hypothetical protein